LRDGGGFDTTILSSYHDGLNPVAEAEEIEKVDIGPDIAENLRNVRREIAEAAHKAEREPDSVTLVAVGKAHPAARSRAALEAGHRIFGENRVQEAEAKWPALKEAFPDSQLHLIGPLQTNKVRHAMAVFDVFETVDRPKLATALAREMDRTGRRPDCLIQVNTGNEAQKAGIAPEAADAFIAQCLGEFELPIRGLMCIPPADEEPSLHFALLREIARRHDLPWLSMGMSADYDVAIAFGATHVRVGTAIFGVRAAH
jgi:pyridoxal phosphate enzyme (YggS family)